MDAFGELAAQLVYLGEVANIAITENAIIAQTNDSEIRTYAEEFSKFRQRDKDTGDLLVSEAHRIKRASLGISGIRSPSR